MFEVSARLAELTLQHRHSDGSWADLERVAHDSADHDPERDWANGIVYRCMKCEEQFRVTPGPGGLAPDER